MEKKDRQMMIDHHINGLVKVIRRDLKEEILEYIWQRTCQMDKLLENGQSIWLQAQGESFHRIHAARQKVYAKIIILRNLLMSINERY